jgi:hypothetical protein
MFVGKLVLWLCGFLAVGLFVLNSRSGFDPLLKKPAQLVPVLNRVATNIQTQQAAAAQPTGGTTHLNIIPTDHLAIAKALHVTNPDYQQAVAFERDVAITGKREQTAQLEQFESTPEPRI